MKAALNTVRKIVFLTFIVTLTSFSFPSDRNYVPDSQTAIKIAEAVWYPIYGDEIYSKRPFVAELTDDSIWHVYGSLPKSYIEIAKNGDTTYVVNHGGVPHIFLNKSDGKIIDVYHTK